MISKERLNYLNTNRIRGEVAKAVEEVNKKSEFKMSKTTANLILSGRIYGINGDAFTNSLEKIITARKAKLAKEAAKYTQDAA